MTETKELSYPLPDVRPVSMRPTSFLHNVDTMLSKVWPVKAKKKYLDEILNKDAVTGKVEYDRFVAAQFIKEEAKTVGLTDIVAAKETKIMRALETLLRRDNLGRKQRIAALLSGAKPTYDVQTPAE
jgi:hypothetical protein